jgi:hypothetical protein
MIMGWTGCAAHMMVDMRNACRILVGKPERKKLFDRSRRSWEDNTKMDLR